MPRAVCPWPRPGRPAAIAAGVPLLVLAALLALLLAPAPAAAQIRISHLSVFLNDLDVTAQIVLVDAVPRTFQESLHSGVPTHVRFTVELWQYSRLWIEKRVQARLIERQLTYNVLTKEYKVASLAGEQGIAPYLTKSLRDAQRVLSEVRVPHIAPATSLDTQEVYYLRVRADTSLNGDNSWAARVAGDAAETPWVRSNLLTVNRTQ
jgi:hypothetical protein